MAPRWLLLAHQLPTRPSHGRVKVWRRLQQVGAVPTRNSVYVLPNAEASREDFEWIRSEIVALGGEATVFAADALSPDAGDELVAAFQRQREPDYRAIEKEAGRLVTTLRRRGQPDASMRQKATRAARALRERLDAVERVD